MRFKNLQSKLYHTAETFAIAEPLLISKFSVNSQEAIDNRQKCVIISDIGEKVIFSRNLKKSKDLGVKCLSDGELPMGRRNFFAVTVLHPASYGTENRP